jgi:hypothetical protein
MDVKQNSTFEFSLKFLQKNFTHGDFASHPSFRGSFLYSLRHKQDRKSLLAYRPRGNGNSDIIGMNGMSIHRNASSTVKPCIGIAARRNTEKGL